MWQEIHALFHRLAKDDKLLTEFEDSLILVVYPEQLANNLLGKLNELMGV